MGGRVNWDWSLGYIDIPLDLSDVSTDADAFDLNLGVYGVNGQFATDQYVNILISESDTPFNDNTSNNAADIFGNGMEVYKHQIRPVDWEGWRFFSVKYSDFEVKSEGGNNVREPAEIRGIRLGLQACPFNSGNCPDNANIEARTDLDYVILRKEQHFWNKSDEGAHSHWNRYFWMGCGSIPEVTLYDVDLTPTVEEQVRNFPHRHVFMDSDNSTMFGVKNHPCKRVNSFKRTRLKERSHFHRVEPNGRLSLPRHRLSMGQLRGKNLRLIEDVAALQFHLRLDSGSVSKVPMFFSLVDYGGKQANTKINLLNVDGKRIDDT